MSSTIPIKIRTQDVSYNDQYTLLDKLTASSHPTINDNVAKKIIEEEIVRRKKNNEWIVNNN